MATHRLELVDRHGRTRIILACVEPPDGGPAIALFSALTALGLRDRGGEEPEPAGADAR